MDNVIKITLKEDKKTGEHDYHIDFESSPTLSELVAVHLIVLEVIENNYDRSQFYTKCAALYDRIRDVEEVLRVP